MIKMILTYMRSIRAGSSTRARWRDQNGHNTTQLGLLPRSEDFFRAVTVGNHTYGTINASFVGAPNSSLTIGSFCSIASDVLFLLGDEHEYRTLSTFPFRVKVFGQGIEAKSKGPVVVEDDVWIGERAIILSGLTIGQGAVVGANSVVTKDIPPYAIVGGCPAFLIKMRFSPAVIDKLLTLDFGAFSDAAILRNLDLLDTPLDEGNVDAFLNVFQGAGHPDSAGTA